MSHVKEAQAVSTKLRKCIDLLGSIKQFSEDTGCSNAGMYLTITIDSGVVIFSHVGVDVVTVRPGHLGAKTTVLDQELYDHLMIDRMALCEVMCDIIGVDERTV